MLARETVENAAIGVGMADKTEDLLSLIHI